MSESLPEPWAGGAAEGLEQESREIVSANSLRDRNELDPCTPPLSVNIEHDAWRNMTRFFDLYLGKG